MRVFIAVFYADIENPVMYEHGEISEHLYKEGTFSMHWPYPTHLPEREWYHKNNLNDISGAWMPPLNPWIIWFSYELFGQTKTAVVFLIILNIIFSVLTVFFIYKLSELFFNPKIAFFAGLLSALYLPNAYGCVTYSGSQLYHLLAATSIYLSTLIYLGKSKKYNYVLLGISLGLLTLIRSEYLLLSVIFLLIIGFKNFKQENVKKPILAGVLFLLIVSPWVVRNSLLFGKPTTIVSHPWHEIWRGNHPEASGGAYISEDRANWLNDRVQSHIIDRLDSLELNQNFEVKADSIFKEEALTSIKENPGKSIIRAFKRVFYLWTYDPHSPRGKDIRYIPFILISIVPFILSLIILYRRKLIDKRFLFLFIHLLFYCLIIFLVNFETRYQVYFHTFLHPVGAFSIALIFDKDLRKNNYNLIKSKD